MSDEQKGKENFKVIEFKKPQEQEVPKFVVELLEKMLEKAKNGQLKTLIAHFNYQEKEEDSYQGGTMFWNETNNPIEILGLTEIVKSVALDYVYGVTAGDKEGEE